MRGAPGFIRSDNGPEFVAIAVRAWIGAVGAKTAFIEPGSPWENGYVESFNGKLRDELVNPEVFNTLPEVRVLTEQWRVHYDTTRPHSSLNDRPPAPEVLVVRAPRVVCRPDPGDAPPPLKPPIHQHYAWITRWGLVTLLRTTLSSPPFDFLTSALEKQFGPPECPT